MSTVELVETLPSTLGPLTPAQRQAIMAHAPALSQDGRRLFRRLLVLAQERGLTDDVIVRAAAQARAHMEAFV